MASTLADVLCHDFYACYLMSFNLQFKLFMFVIDHLYYPIFVRIFFSHVHVLHILTLYLNVLDVDMEGEHWRRCTFYTNKAMGLATGAIYVNATSIDKSMSRVIVIHLSFTIILHLCYIVV
jgi:hypothetical protein